MPLKHTKSAAPPDMFPEMAQVRNINAMREAMPDIITEGLNSVYEKLSFYGEVPQEHMIEAACEAVKEYISICYDYGRPLDV